MIAFASKNFAGQCKPGLHQVIDQSQHAMTFEHPAAASGQSAAWNLIWVLISPGSPLATSIKGHLKAGKK